ncbi:UNKNOWN [Stylonychia lemnae]|uniref:Uncharacterized protein n=1 Tax=Stylonychia lemnae TaxID=5949 RepID=A0A078AQI2_STYLE|nr:UNKNOWN [Stylonychia lemnae]|eukprot:CDW83512.1 UNKNOWN [Stylonychia lemnae]
MKGQRTPTRFGMQTNKSIKRNYTIAKNVQLKQNRNIDFVERPSAYDTSVKKTCDVCITKKIQLKKHHEQIQKVEESRAKRDGRLFVPTKFTFDNKGCRNCQQEQYIVLKDTVELDVINSNERKRSLKENNFFLESIDEVEAGTKSCSATDESQEVKIIEQQKKQPKVRNEKKVERRLMKGQNGKKPQVEYSENEEVKIEEPPVKIVRKEVSTYHNHEFVMDKEDYEEKHGKIYQSERERNSDRRINFKFPRPNKPENVLAQFGGKGQADLYREIQDYKKKKSDKNYYERDIKDEMKITKMGLLFNF